MLSGCLGLHRGRLVPAELGRDLCPLLLSRALGKSVIEFNKLQVRLFARQYSTTGGWS